ncbi:MAG: 50S ribosomal protein L16 [Planctomycetota bacterium]
MALQPSRVKWRKPQKGVIRGHATRGNKVSFGDYGLQALEASRITERQIEACRVATQRIIPTSGKMYIRIFPHRSWSAIPLETRMGKGKGEPEYFAAVVRPGTMLFELGNVPFELAKQAFARAAQKLPIRCRLVTRREF